MATVRVIDLRDNLSDVLNFVRFKNGRVTITRRGRAIAEIVPLVPASTPVPITRTQSAIPA